MINSQDWAALEAGPTKSKFTWMIEHQGFIWLFDAALVCLGSQDFDWPVFRTYLRAGIKICPLKWIEFSETVVEPC